MRIGRLTICIGIAVFSWCGVGIANSGAPKGIDERFRIAVERLGRVTVEESVRAFEDVLAENESYAPAYAEIARLYMALNTPLDRQRAEKMVRQAIRLDPDNPTYQVLLGDLMWQQGFLSNAKGKYEEVLAGNPQDARAEFGLGRYYTKDYLKYLNMIDMEGGSARSVPEWQRFSPTDLMQRWNSIDGVEKGHPMLLKWRQFAEVYRERAIRHLQRSIRFDPRFKDAYYQLGLVYMEDMTSAPAAAGNALVNVASSLLKEYPGDKDAMLFVGLGYQVGGFPDNAWDYYVASLERMNAEERSIFESVATVAEDEERARIERADSQANRKGGRWVESPERERFWLKQDPLLLTERNERRMEHYRRVAYANLRFGKPRQGVAGWRTPMGRVYIKYGDPLGRTVTRPELGHRGRLVQAHMEMWAYEGFSFRFRNWNGLDGWHFDVSRTLPSGEWTLRRTPQRYVDPYRELKYSLPFQAAAFRDAGKIRLEVAYAIAKERLEVSDTGAVDLQDGLFLFGGDWNEVSRAVYDTRRLADVGVDSVRGRYFLSGSTLMVEPGDYNLIAEVQDRKSRSIGTFRNTFALAAEDSSPAMSDLLVATDIEMDDPFPERREDLKVALNPLHTFFRSESMYIYFEVYNLEKDDFGRTKFEITYRIGQPDETEVIPERFEAVQMAGPPGKVRITLGRSLEGGRVEIRANYLPAKRNMVSRTLRRFDGGTGETAVTVRYEGDRTDDFTWLQIDLDRVPEGVHRLSVELKDLNREGQGDERRVLFRVIE